MNKRKEKVADLIDRFIEGLFSGKMGVEEGEGILEQLQGLADVAVSRAIEIFESSGPEDRFAVLLLLREFGDPRAVKPLRRILRQPDYSDEEKMRVIRTLEVLGAPVDEATFRRVISDPEALMRSGVEQMLATVGEPEEVEAFLEMMAESPPEELALYIQEMLTPLADRRLLLMLTALLHVEHDDIIITVIDAIERIKEPATIPLLEERARYDPSRRVRRAAEKAVLRLQVRVGDPDEERLPWIALSSLPLAHCLLCTIDGSGGQVLIVAREQSDGNLQVLDLMFNDHEGIKDCFSFVMDEEELGEMTSSFGSAEFVDISLERARAEIARAYPITLETGRRLPPAFMAWRGWLEGDDSRSLDVFPAPVLEPSRQAELLEECVELLDLEEFEFWFFNPDEVRPFMSRYQELLPLTRSEREKFGALLDDAIEVVVRDNYAPLLPGRLRRQAWLLAQIYEDEEIPLWALAAAAAIEEGVLVDHPLLRDMMEVSFNNAIGGYLRGALSQ